MYYVRYKRLRKPETYMEGRRNGFKEALYESERQFATADEARAWVEKATKEVKGFIYLTTWHIDPVELAKWATSPTYTEQGTDAEMIGRAY